MEKEITESNEDDSDNVKDEDFNIDDLLNEEEDSPIEEKMTEESLPTSTTKEEKKSRGRPKGTTKKNKISEVPMEVAEADKEISNMEWRPYSQPAYKGFQNIKTGEMIDNDEAILRILCYAQEAARNSR